MSADASDLAPSFPLAETIRAASESPTVEAFRATPLYRRHGADLEIWLRTIHRGGAPPRPRETDGRIRLAHWNIQQGKRWDRLLDSIEGQQRLRDADLWTLNEVDVGMARSQNRHVAAAMAERLGLQWVFAANYLELTKGPGEDAGAPGENALGLHGIALLSRWPIEDAGTGDLPECWDYFSFPEEKRYGCRRVLWARVSHPLGELLLATLHTEVRNRPRCRDRQVAAALSHLPDGPCLIGGDFNTHTFRRGGLAEQAAEFARLIATPRDRLDRQLLEPSKREPLLRRLEAAGFDLRGWNDFNPTARQVLSGVEELDRLPAGVGMWLRRRFGLESRTLRLRLDWIGVRGGFSAESDGSPAWTLTEEGPEGRGASDHAPIGAVVRLP